MTAMGRRRMLRGVATAVIGCTLIPNMTESATRLGDELPGPPESLIKEKTQTQTQLRPPPKNRSKPRRRCGLHYHRLRCVF